MKKSDQQTNHLNSASLHADFQKHLTQKNKKLQALYKAVRSLLIEMYPEGNELLYKTHALTSVYTTTLKLSDAYCHIPVYSEHLNLGFNFGTSLDDPKGLLQGTGKSIRHVPIKSKEELDNKDLKILIADAVAHSITHQKQASKEKGVVVSKIKS